MLSRKEMFSIKAGDKYFFSALYQQRPYAKEGQRYKRDWFSKKLKAVPDGVKIVFVLRYWDKAGSEDGDYTAGVLMAYCSDGFFYILDVVRGRWTTYERHTAMRETAKADLAKYGPVLIYHQQDPGSAGVDSALDTNRALVGFSAFFEPVSGSKEMRSGPLESGFQGKLVILLEGNWNDEFVEELCAFPRGGYDDQVDAASSAYSKLCEIKDLMEEQEDQEEVVVYEERVEISPV
jgi:predicted phage terminase large subunit-like protein